MTDEKIDIITKEAPKTGTGESKRYITMASSKYPVGYEALGELRNTRLHGQVVDVEANVQRYLVKILLPSIKKAQAK